MEISTEALGQVIRELRLAKGMTQDELGGEAHYQGGAAVSISRIENGLTRPGAQRLADIATALDLSLRQLEVKAAQRTRDLLSGKSPTQGKGHERIRDRRRRIEQEIGRRTGVITELSEAFNKALEQARDGFFKRFVEIASDVHGAPPPNEPENLQDASVTGADAEAAYLRSTSYRVAHMLVSGAGGPAGGVAVGTSADHWALMTAGPLGTASPGYAFSPFVGVTAASAARALLAGGALPTAMLLGPAVGIAGFVVAALTTRKQQQELTEKLSAADAELAATRRGFDAVADLLPRATETLDYIAVHAGHALTKWEAQLGARPLDWASMQEGERQRYQDFMDISASQLSLLTIDMTGLMTSRGDDRERLIELADEVLNQSKAVVEALV